MRLKLALVTCFSMASLLFVTATSEATTIQFVDTYTPTGSPVEFSIGDSFDYSHDITPPVSSNNSLQAFIDGTLTAGAGYDSSTDTLTSGSITFYFNVTDSGQSEKKFTLSLGGDPAFDGSVPNGTPTTFVVGGAQFQVDWVTNNGLLLVDLTRSNNNGDVFFIKSVLDVSGTREEEDGEVNPNLLATPEPASLVLLGSGLLGGAWRLRKRRPTSV